MEKTDLVKVICGGGLNKNDNWLELSEFFPGQATVLRNFEPSMYGGYRRISGYQPLNEDFNEVNPSGAEGKILGVFVFDQFAYCARKDIGNNTYSFYRYNSGSDWTLVSGGYNPSSSGVVKIRYGLFNFNGTDKIIFVDGVNPPVVYDGSTWNVLAGDQLDTLKPKYVSVFKNHIFVSGDDDYPHIVAHSAPTNETKWDAADGAGQIIAGYDVVQLKAWRENLIVFGHDAIKYINVNNTSFVLNEITSNLGCISSDSVVEANGDILFMAHDGIRPISATERNEDFELGSISKNIQELFNTIYTNVRNDDVNGVTIRGKSQVRFFFSYEGQDEKLSRGILGGLINSREGLRWEWSQLVGIKVSCITSGCIDNKESVIHGGYDGTVYIQETGSSFNGRAISAMYVTPYLDFGNPVLRKSLKSVKVFFRPEGKLSVNFGLGFDWGDEENMNNLVPDWLLEGEGTVSYYNQAIYNQSNYSGVPLPFVFQNIEGSGFSSRFLFVSEDTNPSYTIQSIVAEITPNGHE